MKAILEFDLDIPEDEVAKCDFYLGDNLEQMWNSLKDIVKGKCK